MLKALMCIFLMLAVSGCVTRTTYSQRNGQTVESKKTLWFWQKDSDKR